MSDFDYYYTSGYKGRGSDILEALRQKDDQTKAEAIDFLIDRGYLHSEEMYNAAYVNAMGDYLGISDYDPDEYDEYNAPVARGTKHSALDEVHQRLREAGKKRRQQRIAQARRMKQRKFEGHHGHHHAAEMEMTPDIMDYPGLPVVPDSYGTNSALDSGNGVPVWYGSAETFEAPFAGAGSLFKFGGNDSALGGFTAKELTESSAIHGDFDHAALNYSGHQNIEARAEGDGEVSERVYIRFSWETPSEYDRIIDEYTITDGVYDEVHQEVQSGNYSGFGSYTYYYDQEDDEGNTEESELEVEYQWG